MKKILVVVSLFVFGISLPVHAGTWDQKEVQKVMDKVQAGKGFDLYAEYPSDQTQTVSIKVAAGLFYEIDLKAKVCYVFYLSTTGGGMSLIPCKIIKDGYPLIAPLINWEK